MRAYRALIRKETVMTLSRFVPWVLASWVSFTAIADEAVVRRNVHLRESPTTASESLRLLVPPDEVDVLDLNPVDGFLHVQTEDGENGWVWARNVRVVATETFEVAVAGAPVDAISPNWSKPVPDARTFHLAGKSCPATGSGKNPDKETNRRKNRIDIPSSYHRVTWNAIASLPGPDDHPKSRENFTEDQLAVIEPFEGVALQTEGYLVAIKPQGGSGESTNCYWTKAAETDWHVALVENPGDGENTSIVVEPTPRIKKNHPKWTVANLKPWLDTDLPVRISGWLLFDPSHENHLGKYRSTLWEIHPVTDIEVWDDENERWLDLDDLP